MVEYHCMQMRAVIKELSVKKNASNIWCSQTLAKKIKDYYFYLFIYLPSSGLRLIKLTVCLIWWPDWQQSNLSVCTEWQAIMDWHFMVMLRLWIISSLQLIKNTHTIMKAWKRMWWNTRFIRSHNERRVSFLTCLDLHPPWKAPSLHF